MEDDLMKKIEEMFNKPVSERENWEHILILKYKFHGSVRDYLLAMGVFKE